MAVASGTALYLTALPPLTPLQISRNLKVVDEEDQNLLELQAQIMEISEHNRLSIQKEIGRAERITERDMSHSKTATMLQTGCPGDDLVHGGGGIFNAADSCSDSESSDSNVETEREAPQPSVVVHVDDDADEDLISVLLDKTLPDNVHLVNIHPTPELLEAILLPGAKPGLVGSADWPPADVPSIRKPPDACTVTLLAHGSISMITHHPNRQLAAIFRSLYDELRFRLLRHVPYVVAGVRYDVQLPRMYEVQVRLSAVVLMPGTSVQGLFNLSDFSRHVSSLFSDAPRLAESVGSLRQLATKATDTVAGLMSSAAAGEKTQPRRAMTMHTGTETRIKPQSCAGLDGPSSSSTHEPMLFAMDNDDDGDITAAYTTVRDSALQAECEPVARNGRKYEQKDTVDGDPAQKLDEIYMTPLSSLPGTVVVRHLGRLSLHFVKEDHVSHDAATGGMASFVSAFTVEVLAIARSHVAALGGNAVLGYNMDQFIFHENLKNQAYALISVSGDVVKAIKCIR